MVSKIQRARFSIARRLRYIGAIKVQSRSLTESRVMTTQVRKTRPSAKLNLKDRLSRLTFLEAAKLLGPEGKRLIQKSANIWDFKIEEDVYLGNDLFRLRFPGEFADRQPVVATITLMAEARDRLNWNCAKCDGACEHVGAAFSLILEEKLRLGLAAKPKERVA